MTFFYTLLSPQVNITQDSLQSFLKVADKLKIKGLCERAMIAPEPPLQHATITLPIKEEKKTNSAASLAHTNFDSLLGRNNYMAEPPAQQLSPGQVVSLAQPSLPPLRHSVTSSAPPAHQVKSYLGHHCFQVVHTLDNVHVDKLLGYSK